MHVRGTVTFTAMSVRKRPVRLGGPCIQRDTLINTKPNPNCMSLIFQPFAKDPGLQRLERDLKNNVSDGERLISAFVGAAVLVAAVSKNGILAKTSLLLTGGALLKRAITGHCDVYDYLNTDSKHTVKSIANSLRA